jgi:precorrin-8X/cobalt-precorrin-8 methylmutase
MPVVFDAYVMVDWSAHSRPKKGADSIWIAVVERPGGTALAPISHNPSTRARAADDLRNVLERLVSSKQRVLVGFDFPYGYPCGFASIAKHANGAAPPWRATWDRLNAEVVDDAHNRNNRFGVAARINEACGLKSGPFWGCPEAAANAWLRSTGVSW